VTPIFNGEDLSGWIPDGSEAEVKAGVLLVREGSGWVRTDRPYGDVVLRLDARLIGRNAEAAIFVRAYPHSDQRRSPPSVGYRIIVKDDRSAGRIVRHDLPGRAPSVPYGTAAPSFADAGAWHRYEIHCTGTSLMVTLDGLPVAALGEVENPGGYLAVQAQRGDVEFRNIELETETYRLSEVATTEPGSGVVLPRVVREVRPTYAREALTRRIQGGVLLEGVVAPDGTLRACQTLTACTD
jgi:hypothetical protein